MIRHYPLPAPLASCRDQIRYFSESRDIGPGAAAPSWHDLHARHLRLLNLNFGSRRSAARAHTRRIMMSRAANLKIVTRTSSHGSRTRSHRRQLSWQVTGVEVEHEVKLSENRRAVTVIHHPGRRGVTVTVTAAAAETDTVTASDSDQPEWITPSRNHRDDGHGTVRVRVTGLFPT